MLNESCEVYENYAEEISAEKLADMLNYSRCHFSVKFKQIMSMTPHEYIKKRRIDRAKELLIEDNTSIEKIAELIGYNDACSFIRAFKSMENITPLQFKKRYFCRWTFLITQNPDNIKTPVHKEPRRINSPRLCYILGFGF